MSDKKSSMDSEELKILEHLKSKAVEVHKLDYGIGGFYQFEPNGQIIPNSALLTINYHDAELTVLLPDSTEYTIDENLLRMYVEDKANNKWIYIGGEVNADSISGIAYLKATSRKGGAAGLTTVVIYEENPPKAPVIISVVLADYTVELNWDPSPDLDLAYYMVYFGTQSGPPYDGTASVLGDPSPVKTGTAGRTVQGFHLLLCHQGN